MEKEHYFTSCPFETWHLINIIDVEFDYVRLPVQKPH